MEQSLPGMVREAAQEMILKRRRDLLIHRQQLKAQQSRLAEQERALDRELAECDAAAKFFGLSFDPTPTEQEIDQLRRQLTMARNRLAHIETEGAERATILSICATIENRLEAALAARHTQQVELKLPVIQAPHHAPLERTVPKIKDIALEQLRVALPAGKKATDIRRYVEATYNTQIHEKTIGMTLYRLARDNLVHRDGQTWFYGPQVGQAPSVDPENPGAATPGPTHAVN